ncbi:ethylene-responsive transcription factor ERF017-like [Apium graveolens]|uniref:ethylene-responsive transcription factor ERF017-like n=1 Tax=Apium graveolens TaxID=4045 RepID=UPI003D7AD622
MEKSATHESNSSQATSSSCKYKGVRLRKWGKYVAEIRLPNSRERIWLGSYDSAVKAARAFDVAQFCLRGPSANFNFPDSLPDIPGARSLTPGQIQVEAAKFANSWSDPDQPVSDNPGAEVQQQADIANTDQAGVEKEKSLLDEFKTMSWESESVSEYGYFQGFDDFQNELFLSGPCVDDEVEEANDQSFTTNTSFLWNF